MNCTGSQPPYGRYRDERPIRPKEKPVPRRHWLSLCSSLMVRLFALLKGFSYFWLKLSSIWSCLSCSRINTMFWVLLTRAPWRDLPLDYGKRSSVHQMFIRWCRKGVWENFWKFWSMNQIMNGWWLTQTISKCISTQQEQEAVIRICLRQKRAQHQNLSGCGCKWYAGPNPCYRRYPSGL